MFPRSGKSVSVRFVWASASYRLPVCLPGDLSALPLHNAPLSASLILCRMLHACALACLDTPAWRARTIASAQACPRVSRICRMRTHGRIRARARFCAHTLRACVQGSAHARDRASEHASTHVPASMRSCPRAARNARLPQRYQTELTK